MHLGGCAIVCHSWESLITIGAPGVDGGKKKRFSRAGAGTAQAGASRLTKRVKIATSPCASITALPSRISSPLFPQHQPPSSPSPCLSLSSLLLTCLRLLVLICCFSDTHHCGESFPITSTASHTSAFESCTEMSFKLLSIMATMTHFQSPGSLPWHDCGSLNAANQPSSPTSPFWRNPASPGSSCWEEEHVLLSCWGESSHFPERLPQEKSSFLSFYLFIFISGGSRLVTACSVSTFYHTPRWCRAPCLKAFQGKRVRDFHAFSSSGPSQSWVIIHSSPPPHNQTPPTALLMQILGRKDCRSLTSAVFSLSRSPVRHISAAKKISQQNHGWERQMWSGGQDGNVHRGTCGLGFYRRTAQRGCNFLRVIDESLGWLF